MLFANLYAMPLLKSGLVLVTGNGIGSPGLTRAASRDLHTVRTSEVTAGGTVTTSSQRERGKERVEVLV